MKTMMTLCLLLSACVVRAQDPALDTGRKAAKALMDALGPQLKQAMQAGGPPAAIQVCGAVAQAMTKAIGANDPAVLGVSRVTDKARNPVNKADPADLAIIKDYLAGKSKEDRVVRDGDRVTYYKPLYIQPLCLNCHGKSESLHPEAVKLLKERYPKDQATGYAEGDFRGLIKVRVAAEKSDVFGNPVCVSCLTPSEGTKPERTSS